MNIQIFGTKKSADTRKAERWFKERRISYQLVDMKEKGMSRGEFDNVLRAVGGLDALIDENTRDKQTLTLLRYLTDDAKPDKVFENQQLIRLPIVRNGKKATVGYAPEVWETWK